MSSGGKRPGSGRKKGPAKRNVTIKHDKKVVDKVRKKFNGHEIQTMGQAWLDVLSGK